MKMPYEIIAEVLPLGPDEWFCDRKEGAAGILKALTKAGYTIVPETWRFEVQEKAWKYDELCK